MLLLLAQATTELQESPSTRAAIDRTAAAVEDVARKSGGDEPWAIALTVLFIGILVDIGLRWWDRRHDRMEKEADRTADLEQREADREHDRQQRVDEWNRQDSQRNHDRLVNLTDRLREGYSKWYAAISEMQTALYAWVLLASALEEKRRTYNGNFDRIQDRQLRALIAAEESNLLTLATRAIQADSNVSTALVYVMAFDNANHRRDLAIVYGYRLQETRHHLADIVAKTTISADEAKRLLDAAMHGINKNVEQIISELVPETLNSALDPSKYEKIPDLEWKKTTK